MERCPVTEKNCYTESEARQKAAFEKKRVFNSVIRVYVCEFCHTWHLTHHKRHSWQK